MERRPKPTQEKEEAPHGGERGFLGSIRGEPGFRWGWEPVMAREAITLNLSQLHETRTIPKGRRGTWHDKVRELGWIV
jgi:hypothetical protein